MGSNFNLGSFNAIDIKEDQKTKKPSSNGNNNELKKKLISIGAIVCGGIFLLFLVLFLITYLFPRHYSYTEIENIMKDAAISYFKDFPDKLPSSSSQRVEINSTTLSDLKYMKNMIKYTGKNLSCTGKVSVLTNGDGYLYIPDLDCGDKYNTEALKDVILKNVVTEGYGLYQIGNNYVYRGEYVDNYIKLDKTMWRIIKVMDSGEMLLILDTKLSESLPWDDRYNAQVGYNIGINNYSTSRIKDSLLGYYDDNGKETAILSDDDRSKLINFDLCIAKKAPDDATKDNSVECTETLSNQRIGLLTVSDYMMASLDANCKNTLNYSCQNYNYLVTDYKWWLSTASTVNTKEAYGVDNSGVVKSSLCSSYMYPRPIVMLDSNVLFKDGKGTFEKPYTIK